MMREYHVRFWEGLRVKSPRPTRQIFLIQVAQYLEAGGVDSKGWSRSRGVSFFSLSFLAACEPWVLAANTPKYLVVCSQTLGMWALSSARNSSGSNSLVSSQSSVFLVMPIWLLSLILSTQAVAGTTTGTGTRTM